MSEKYWTSNFYTITTPRRISFGIDCEMYGILLFEWMRFLSVAAACFFFFTYSSTRLGSARLGSCLLCYVCRFMLCGVFLFGCCAFEYKSFVFDCCFLCSASVKMLFSTHPLFSLAPANVFLFACVYCTHFCISYSFHSRIFAVRCCLPAAWCWWVMAWACICACFIGKKSRINRINGFTLCEPIRQFRLLAEKCVWKQRSG